MAVQFLAFIKPMMELVGSAFNKITDSKSFVEAVNQWGDEKTKDLALKIIEESESMNDKEKLDAIKELNEYIDKQKKEAASEIRNHKIQMARIFIGILSAGFSIPVEALSKVANKKNNTTNLNNVEDTADALEIKADLKE